MEEFEVKFLGIDPAEIGRKVLEAGGRRLFDRVYHRAVYDYPDLRLDQQGAWVRVRDEGDKVTLAFKQRLGYTETKDNSGRDKGMIEEEVVVSDFETACEILRRIGLTEKFYQENRRVRYALAGVHVDVDYWPRLDPYIEIEGDSWEAVERTIAALGLNPKDRKLFSTTQIYELSGINDKHYRRMTFKEMVKRPQ